MFKKVRKGSGFSLTFKMSLGFTVLIAVLIGTVGFSIFVRDRDALNEQLINRGWAIIKTANSFSADAIKTQNYVSLGGMVKNLCKDRFVTQAAIIDNSGKLLAYDGPEDIEFKLNYGPIRDVMKTNEEKVTPIANKAGEISSIAFTSPIIDTYGMTHGYFYILVDYSNIHNHLMRMGYFIIINFLLAFIAGLLLTRLIITKSVGKPVQSLVHATEKISIGDFSYELPVASKDELGRLSRAFNVMGDQLGVLFSSIRNIVKDISYTSNLISERSMFLEEAVEPERKAQVLKEIHSGSRRLVRMSDQLNSLAMQYKVQG